MDLDRELVREAAAVLGTSRIVETVHGALSEVVRARKRLRPLEFDMDLSVVDLERMRAPRFDISEGDGSRTLGS